MHVSAVFKSEEFIIYGFINDEQFYIFGIHNDKFTLFEDAYVIIFYEIMKSVHLFLTSINNLDHLNSKINFTFKINFCSY